jgi:hypothetical protein
MTVTSAGVYDMRCCATYISSYIQSETFNQYLLSLLDRKSRGMQSKTEAFPHGDRPKPDRWG